jgi:trimeric autotransporter adhesin
VHLQAQNDIYVGISQTERVHIIATEAVTVAPVYGNPIAGSAVTVNANGQLGVAPSSKRFKNDINPMAQSSEAILELKPVTFRYKTEIDHNSTPQFGLVAEDVEKVNPDLVVRDKESKPYSVRYDAVNAMLRNEFLKEHQKVEQLEATVARLTTRLEEQDSKIAKLSDQLEMSRSASRVAASR